MWEEPDALPAKGDVILSLLSPSVEQRWHKQREGREFLFARRRAADVRDEALALYLKITSNIGAVKDEAGTTLRQAIKKGSTSLWWYHPISRKYCEGDPEYNRIIQVLTIRQAYEEFRCSDITLIGCPSDMAKVLRGIVKVKSVKEGIHFALWSDVLKPLLKRLKLFLKSLYIHFMLKPTAKKRKQQTFDVLLAGSWDWSVREHSTTEEIEDKYFKALPDKLKSRGATVGWLAWFSREGDHRNFQDVVRPLERHPEILIAQSYNRISDIFKTVWDLKPYFVYSRYRKLESFKGLFMYGELNLLPLFARNLSAGFLDAMIPRYALMASAYRRAAEQIQPKNVVNFLDFFPQARAVNAGFKEGSPNTRLVDVQHASYSRGKTFGIIDEKLEFDGKPDGCAIPKPDVLCAMGALGREIFIEGGYAAADVLETGSTRYDLAARDDVEAAPKFNAGKNILLVPTLQKMGLELEMIDAVYAAFANIPEVTVNLRAHPFSDIETSVDFQKYKGRIHCTANTTLEQDLAKADIVIFTYSTVAEEAFIKGIPVWQWVSAAYNASIFRDVPVIPTFSTVEELAHLYRDFKSNMAKYMPSVEQRRLVKQQCFYGSADYLPSDRIADFLTGREFRNTESIPEGEINVKV